MRTTLTTLHKMSQESNKIAMLTCYDASFASLLESAGVDGLLIGDSLGMVLQGQDSTLSVTMNDMIYHTRCVARGSKKAFIVTDMPFASYQVSSGQAFENAALLLAAGAQMVKLEGGEVVADTVSFMTKRGIAVCGHIGFTPQSVHQFGGYSVQGKTEAQSKHLLEQAKMLEQAGIGLLVLEAIPATVADKITAAIKVPTIGIGAGSGCSGQVLVLHDMLDIYPGKKARFVKNFTHGAASVEAAVKAYVNEVKARTFPGTEHSF